MTDAATTSKIDPVCGMTVDLVTAEANGLTMEYEGETYVFCGRGCLLDFRDDPATYLDVASVPGQTARIFSVDPNAASGAKDTGGIRRCVPATVAALRAPATTASRRRRPTSA